MATVVETKFGSSWKTEVASSNKIEVVVKQIWSGLFLI